MNKSTARRRSIPTPEGPPLHRVVADALRAELRGGRPAPGASMPPEGELAGRFGVARGTVRQALATLRAEGWLAGGRGAPPVVREPQLAQPLSELVSFTSWLRSLGLVPGGRLIDSRWVKATPAIAVRLGVRPGSPLFRIVRLRLADGEPVMIERTVFPGAAGAIVAGLDVVSGSIYAGLEDHGIVPTVAHHAIDAVAASAADAALLATRRGAPLLRIRRHTLTQAGNPLEWSEDRYRSSRVMVAIDHDARQPAIARRLAKEDR